MEELTKSIQTVQTDLDANIIAFLKGNKAAGVRARKNTLVLERLYKQFRKDSVATSK